MENLKSSNISKSSEPLGNQMSSLRENSKLQSFPNFVKNTNKQGGVKLCQPKPRKAINLDELAHEENEPQGFHARARFSREEYYNDSEEDNDFIQELEDRIEADLEIEGIF